MTAEEQRVLGDLVHVQRRQELVGGSRVSLSIQPDLRVGERKHVHPAARHLVLADEHYHCGPVERPRIGSIDEFEPTLDGVASFRLLHANC